MGAEIRGQILLLGGVTETPRIGTAFNPKFWPLMGFRLARSNVASNTTKLQNIMRAGISYGTGL